MAESIVEMPYQDFPKRTTQKVTSFTARGTTYTVQDEGMCICQATATSRSGALAIISINDRVVVGIGGTQNVSGAPGIERTVRVYPGDVITTRSDVGSYYVQVDKFV